MGCKCAKATSLQPEGTITFLEISGQKQILPTAKGKSRIIKASNPSDSPESNVDAKDVPIGHKMVNQGRRHAALEDASGLGCSSRLENVQRSDSASAKPRQGEIDSSSVYHPVKVWPVSAKRPSDGSATSRAASGVRSSCLFKSRRDKRARKIYQSPLSSTEDVSSVVTPSATKRKENDKFFEALDGPDKAILPMPPAGLRVEEKVKLCTLADSMQSSSKGVRFVSPQLSLDKDSKLSPSGSSTVNEGVEKHTASPLPNSISLNATTTAVDYPRTIELDVDIMAADLTELCMCSLDDAQNALRLCNYRLDEAYTFLTTMQNNHDRHDDSRTSKFGWLLANKYHLLQSDSSSPKQKFHLEWEKSQPCRLFALPDVKYPNLYQTLSLIDPLLFSVYGKKMSQKPLNESISRRSLNSPAASSHSPQESSLLEKFDRYQAMMRLQQSILPAHLQQSESYSEIILQSSVVVGGAGQMIMLPWNDNDFDVKSNFWLEAYPESVLRLLRHKHRRRQKTLLDPKTETTHFLGTMSNASSYVPKDYDQDSSTISDQQQQQQQQQQLHQRSTMAPPPWMYSPIEENNDLPPYLQINAKSLSMKGNFYGRSKHSYDDEHSYAYQSERRHASAIITAVSDHPTVKSSMRNSLWRTPSAVKTSPTTTAAVAIGGDYSSGCYERSLAKQHHHHHNKTCRQQPATLQVASPLDRQSSMRDLHDEQQSSSRQHPSIICRAKALTISPSFFFDESNLDFSALDSPGLFYEGWSLDDGKWTDPDGFISLSQKQRQKFHAWRRITELELPAGSNSSSHGNNGVCVPCIIAERPRSSTIRQGFVGDCSFLSSLAVLAEYEKRHQIPILSSIIYPQLKKSQNKIVPVINEKGLYACRLHFNGVPRKVLLDDYVPIRKDGKLLAAHTSSRREYWVTLLEKSFVKLMGGSYFMQGSNPGADLYHLTGWIPETMPFRVDIHTGGPDKHKPIITGGDNNINFQFEPKWIAIWDLLYDGLINGKCVACLGTSEVADAAPSGLEYPEGVSQSSGIVARHAYSVLSYREINGARLLYVKNPWCCIRWRGNYGPHDKKKWTPELQAALLYDQERRAELDDGCFWINWNDVVKWFSHLYICWNSACFEYQTEIHSEWDRSIYIDNSLLPDDSHLVGFNPQFLLTVAANEKEDPSDSNNNNNNNIAEVWVLLSRHVRERKRDLSQKYLAIHIHSGSERVACPPPAAKQGIYSNGECTLVKLRVDLSSENETGVDANDEAHPDETTQMMSQQPPTTNNLEKKEFVLVVSQYSQKDEFNFTIKVYSRIHSTLTQLPPLIPPNQGWLSVYRRGYWETNTAGGCSNELWSYFKNPQSRLILPTAADAVIFLECPLEHSVNLRVFKHPAATARLLRSGKAISSGPYRSGCCVIQTRLEAGVYTLVASTFRPGELGEYQISLHIGNFETPMTVDDIILKPLPHPYNEPPLTEFFHCQIVSTPHTQKRINGIGYMIRIDCPPARIENITAALRLQINSATSLNFVFPSLIVYRRRRKSKRSCAAANGNACFVSDELSNNITRSTYIAPPSPDLIPTAWSDLEGGQSASNRPLSSAAQDLCKKHGIVTLSNLTIEPQRCPYFAVIYPVMLDRNVADGASTPCLVPITSIAPSMSLESPFNDFVLSVISESEILLQWP